MSRPPAIALRLPATSTAPRLLRRGVAQAGRGLPAIEPGMPTPAGTGLSRRGFLLSSAGLALSVYGAGRLLDPPAFEDGHRARGRERPRSRCSSASTCRAASTRCRSSIRPATRSTPIPHRRSRCRTAPARPFTEDPRLLWHPLAAPLAQLHGEGKVSVMPTIGYTDPDQSHFTSRHYWEVGATQADLHDRLDGPLPRPRRHRRQPASRALPRRLAVSPALATARLPVATIDLPSAYSFWAQGVWGPPQDLMYDAFDALGHVGVRSRDPGMAQSGQAALMSNTLRRQLLPFQPATGASAAAARRLPDRDATRSRRGWPRSPSCSAPGCR